ncbi:hypothetical protein N473_19460 [Pseudoalteromonas luteoviolacea CPMOR-1]|uniref:Uncharacterized protein n=1 Tax=Pseudoalteromonas luteoviolacea CPMOR-1 TaxID=1365248 RepID=A0A162BID8_9GAMM|nr:hypothetical protein [Pseudoalteromonas luteoviolacea]KZN62433.1 hypothetical protein N473_19460 [Pseudoalteromonas luteoviolacea CPMOR-1]
MVTVENIIVQPVRQYKTLSEAIASLKEESSTTLSTMCNDSSLIQVVWNSEESRCGRAVYSLKKIKGNDSDIIDGQFIAGRYIGANFEIHEALSICLVLRPNKDTNACVFGAIGDGIVDDTSALNKYWAYTLKHQLTFDLSAKRAYKLTAANSTAGLPVYFSTDGHNDIDIKMGESELRVDPPVIESAPRQGPAILFECKGTNGFSFDQIKGHANGKKAELGDTLTLLYICHKEQGSHKVRGGTVQGKNVSGVRATTDLSDYQKHGRSSAYRSRDIVIDNILIDNTEMTFNPSFEYLGYGLVCQCSGDDLVVNSLKVSNIHRGFFAYGVSGVTVRSGTITESTAATVNIGSYGSCEDIEANLTLNQNYDLPTELSRILVYEKGTSNGGSLDLIGGRTHICAGIKLNLIASGSAKQSKTGFSLNKSTVEGENGAIEFRDIDISLRHDMPGASRALSIFNQATEQLTSNMRVEGIRLNDCTVSSVNSVIIIPPGAESDIVVSNLITGGSVYCGYGDKVTNTLPNAQLVFNTSVINGTTSIDGLYDCPITFINSQVAKHLSSAHIVPAQNKTFINSKIGNALVNKSPWSIYTGITSTTASYNPDFTVNNLVMGGVVTSSENKQPQVLNLIAPSDVKTEQFANFYLEQFQGPLVYSSTKTYHVSITAMKNGSSGFGLIKGYLTVIGVPDPVKGNVLLDITSVKNTGGQSFLASDFSLNIVDANNLQLECASLCRDLYLTVQQV